MTRSFKCAKRFPLEKLPAASRVGGVSVTLLQTWLILLALMLTCFKTWLMTSGWQVSFPAQAFVPGCQMKACWRERGARKPTGGRCRVMTAGLGETRTRSTNTQWNFCVWTLKAHYGSPHQRRRSITTSSSSLWEQTTNQAALKSSLKMTSRTWWAVKHWLLCKNLDICAQREGDSLTDHNGWQLVARQHKRQGS